MNVAEAVGSRRLAVVIIEWSGYAEAVLDVPATFTEDEVADAARNAELDDGFESGPDFSARFVSDEDGWATVRRSAYLRVVQISEDGRYIADFKDRDDWEEFRAEAAELDVPDPKRPIPGQLSILGDHVPLAEDDR